MAVFIAFPLNRFVCAIVFNQNHIVGMNLNFQFLSLLILGAVLFGVVTVVIPAFRISKVMPAIAIQLATKSDNNVFWAKTRKKWTIVLSHILLFTVLSLGAFFTTQCYLNSFRGLGYQGKNVLTIMAEERGRNNYSDGHNSKKYEGFKENLLKINGVKQVSYVLENPPDWIIPQFQEYTSGGDEMRVRTLETDDEFFEILNYKPLEGELYSKSTISPKYIYGVVTKLAQKKYFEGDAVGKVLKRKEDGKLVMIIGVIAKYKHHIMADDYNGIFTLRNHPSRSLILKYDENTNSAQLEKEIRTLIKTNYSNCFLNHNEDIEACTQRSLKKLYAMFYGIVFIMVYLLLITVLGFLTLGWYNVRSRRKELGVRRSVGASKRSIKRKIINENLFLMLLGSGISALLISQGLSLVIPNDKQGFLWIGLSVAFVLCLVMNLISVYFPAQKAATITPVEALAEE